MIVSAVDAGHAACDTAGEMNTPTRMCVRLDGYVTGTGGARIPRLELESQTALPTGAAELVHAVG